MISRATARCRFAGIELLAGRGVFVPMAISEPLVTAALEGTAGASAGVVLEAGTGCGAVGLAVATADRALEVHAAELMPKALRWARLNRERLGLTNVSLYGGSLLDEMPERLRGRADVVIANLPYVRPERAKMGPDALGAVLGQGEDGLELPRRLAHQALDYLRPGGRLVLQLGTEQWPRFSEELVGLGYRPGAIASETATDMVVWVERAR
jgi:release factor glutamine methyltransferase